MTIPRLTEQLDESTSLLDFATKLGRICLDHGGYLKAKADAAESRPITEWIETTVEAQPDLWTAAAGAGSTELLRRDGDVGIMLSIAEARHPVAHLAVLRGLCDNALTRFWDRAGRVALDRGTPVPTAIRPIPKIIEEPTPNPVTTMKTGHLLEGKAFTLFEYSAQGMVPVAIDFTHRVRLDELTWTGTGQLPKIATLHPFLGIETMEIGTELRTSFFDVRPKNWDSKTILSSLRLLSNAAIAVLPELCLPVANVLEKALGSDPERYPALVVAGSAHVRELNESGDEVRANECRIYLDGDPIAAHRKIHPFKTRHLAGHELAEPSREALTEEIKGITVLSGDRTRFAVVLCADLNDGPENSIPHVLECAGVNLLIVPALTNGQGGFHGAITGLASRCQGLAVVVNANLDANPRSDPPGLPFLILVAVPRASSEEQDLEYPTNGQPRNYANLLDPNKHLAEALEPAQL